MPNVRDHDASVYLKVQGDALHIGGYERDPVFWDVDQDFAFGLFDLVSALSSRSRSSSSSGNNNRNNISSSLDPK